MTTNNIVCISFPASVDPFEDRDAIIELIKTVPDLRVTATTPDISVYFPAKYFAYVASQLDDFINDPLTIR